MRTFVLDACALIAYFAKEDGAENVKELFALLTSDHHQFESIEQEEKITIKWFR